MKVVVNWRRRKSEFRYPVEPVPRTAVLEPWFRSRRVEAAPQAIAASWPRLQDFVREGTIAPTHGVVVLHRSREFAPLTAADRDWLWRTFRVPIFEQVIGPRGELLATECAAHDGMHIESASLPLNGSANLHVDESPCGCGRGTPRLVSSQPVERLRAAAAYAR